MTGSLHPTPIKKLHRGDNDKWQMTNKERQTSRLKDWIWLVSDALKTIFAHISFPKIYPWNCHFEVVLIKLAPRPIQSISCYVRLLSVVCPNCVSFYCRGMENSSQRESSLIRLSNFFFFWFSLFLFSFFLLYQSPSLPRLDYQTSWKFIAAEAAYSGMGDMWQVTCNMWHITHDHIYFLFLFICGISSFY